MKALFLCLLAISVVWGSPIYAEGHLLQLDAEQRSHLDLRTALPEPVSAIPLAQAPGRVTLPPTQEFAVTAVQSGVITRVNVPIGAQVRQGDLLAEIDSIALVDLQRALVDARAILNVSESKLKRDDTLLREGVISTARWQETRSTFEQAQAGARAAEQSLLATGVGVPAVERLKADGHISGLYPVTSPVDGFVLARLAIVGQRVDTLAPLFRIGKLGELWLEVEMPQERLQEVKLGDRISVEKPKARARIIEIGSSIDPQSQTALVRAVVEQGREQLRPGMNVNVQTLHRSTDRMFKVPVSAVFYHEGKGFVFVKRPAGFDAVPVTVAGQEAYHVVVHDGLHAGDAVVVQGVSSLKSAWMAATNDQPAEH